VDAAERLLFRGGKAGYYLPRISRIDTDGFLYYFILTTTSTTFRGKEGKGERRYLINDNTDNLRGNQLPAALKELSYRKQRNL
jgi:hypothetical protein